MKYACLCCGYKTLNEQPPGTFGICDICGWEDDNADGGANKVTLKEAKENFNKFGMSDPNHLQIKKMIRQPTEQDDRDPNWENLYYPDK
ncbi:MAG: CPCC family cysteine-rich protein [Patescibacteria group bacterium]